jgi:hypothetical protein
VRGEKDHFGCGECDGDYCSACADECQIKPSLKLKCGHAIHKECLEGIFRTASNAGKIKLPRCPFPGCNQIPDHALMAAQSGPWVVLRDKIEELTNSTAAKLPNFNNKNSNDC